MQSPSPHRPVVVGYDGSAPSEAALQWAARAADHRDRGLVVLHAAERITYAQDAGSGIWKREDVLAQAEEVAAEGRDKVHENFPDLHVETAASLFTAKIAIGELSTRASIVVVGSHGRGRIGTLLLGSTAYAIAGYARCPVVVVRDGVGELPGPDNPVVVGVNGTSGSDRATSTAVDVAREWGSSLLLVTSWVAAASDRRGRGPAGYSSADEASSEHKATAEEANAASLAQVRAAHPDIQIDGAVIEAHPVDGLVQAAERGGLLVLGTQGRGSMAGALLGSTSLGVLHSARSAIMVVD